MDDASAALAADGGVRDGKHVLAGLHHDGRVGCHVGLEQTAQLVDGDHDVVLHHILLHLRLRVDGGHLAGEFLVRVSVHEEGRLLPLLDPPDVRLVHEGVYLDSIEVQDGDEGRRREAGCDSLALLRGNRSDNAGDRRMDLRMPQLRFGLAQSSARLLDLCASGLGGPALQLHVHLLRPCLPQCRLGSLHLRPRRLDLLPADRHAAGVSTCGPQRGLHAGDLHLRGGDIALGQLHLDRATLSLCQLRAGLVKLGPSLLQVLGQRLGAQKLQVLASGLEVGVCHIALGLTPIDLLGRNVILLEECECAPKILPGLAQPALSLPYRGFGAGNLLSPCAAFDARQLRLSTAHAGLCLRDLGV